MEGTPSQCWDFGQIHLQLLFIFAPSLIYTFKYIILEDIPWTFKGTLVHRMR